MYMHRVEVWIILCYGWTVTKKGKIYAMRYVLPYWDWAGLVQVGSAGAMPCLVQDQCWCIHDQEQVHRILRSDCIRRGYIGGGFHPRPSPPSQIVYLHQLHMY